MVGTIGNTEWGLRNMTLSLVLVLSLSVTLKADDGPTFEQANKILTKYCAGCHNAEEANGDFALDSYDAIVKGGENGNVMTPGSANSSRMIQMINGKLEPLNLERAAQTENRLRQNSTPPKSSQKRKPTPSPHSLSPVTKNLMRSVDLVRSKFAIQILTIRLFQSKVFPAK